MNEYICMYVNEEMKTPQLQIKMAASWWWAAAAAASQAVVGQAGWLAGWQAGRQAGSSRQSDEPNQQGGSLLRLAAAAVAAAGSQAPIAQLSQTNVKTLIYGVASSPFSDVEILFSSEACVFVICEISRNLSFPDGIESGTDIYFRVTGPAAGAL